MSSEFWVALISFLTAGAGLLTAARQRLSSQKTEARVQATKAKAEAETELHKERREAAERERKAAQEALEFREKLRLEAIAERTILEDKIEALALGLKEATNVMERATALTERVLDSAIAIGALPIQRPDGTRTRSTDRTAPRRGTRPSARSTGFGQGGDRTGRGET